MARNPADLEIVSVVAPDIVEPGSSASVEVEVRNRNQTAAPDETHDVGYVAVVAPTASPSLVILDCFVIAPGATHTVDDCSSAADDCGDGEFVMPEGPVVLDVFAGGFQEGTNCGAVDYTGNATDTVQHQVNPFISPVVMDCQSSPDDVSYGDNLGFSATVRNQNEVPVDVLVEFTVGGTTADRSSATIPANSSGSVEGSVAVDASYPGGEGTFDTGARVLSASASARTYRSRFARFRRTLTA